MAKRCDFTENDNMLRDKIVFDTQSVALKERLLREKDLDLTKTIDICRASEIAQRELRTMKSAQAPSTATARAMHHVKSQPVAPKPQQSSSCTKTNW